VETIGKNPLPDISVEFSRWTVAPPYTEFLAPGTDRFQSGTAQCLVLRAQGEKNNFRARLDNCALQHLLYCIAAK
jgi:hypothetical protein